MDPIFATLDVFPKFCGIVVIAYCLKFTVLSPNCIALVDENILFPGTKPKP